MGCSVKKMKIIYINGNRDIDINGYDGKATHVRGVIESFSTEHIVYYFTKNEKYVNSTSGRIYYYQSVEDIVKVVNSLQFDFAYERYCLHSYEGIEITQLLKIPIIMEFNFSFVYGNEKDKSIVDIEDAFECEKRVLLSSDYIVTVSDVLQDYLNKIGVRQSMIFPACVDPIIFKPEITKRNKIRNKYNLLDEIVVGFVGSFQKYHGLEIVIEVINKVHDSNIKKIIFMLVGDGKYYDEFKNEISTKNLEDYVVFTGRLDQDNVVNAIAAFDIAIMTTPQYEKDKYFWKYHGVPVKILEYMSMAKPTISPEIQTLKHIILHDINGYVVKIGDSEAFFNAIICLRDNVEKRDKIGRAARETIIAKYTWKRKTDAIITLAKNLINNKGAFN